VELSLVTAMLPHEFYNWPQIAVRPTSNNRRSADIIARTWTNSRSYFDNMARLKGHIRLRRYVLVQQGENLFSPSLRTVADLRAASTLSLAWNQVTLSYFIQKGLDDLFETTTRYRLADVKAFVGCDEFKFYPVGAEQQLRDVGLKPKRLFSHFATTLHSSDDDARYCEITVDSAQTLAALMDKGRLEAGHLPELAHFRLVPKPGQPGVSAEFAVLSELTPYTESIEVSLIPEIGERPWMTDFIDVLQRDSRGLAEISAA
jgi:hypothetical protein